MEKEIICLCPYCKKGIEMRFIVKDLRIDVKELKTWKYKKKRNKEVVSR